MNPKIIFITMFLFALVLMGCEEKDQKETNPGEQPGSTRTAEESIGNREPEDAQNFSTRSDYNSQIRHIGTDYLGCFNKENASGEGAFSDTLYYELNDDTLLLHIVMWQNCGCILTDSVVTGRDTTNIYIADTLGLEANCICDYRFQYHFTDFGGQMYFEVFYKAKDEPYFNLWGELEYP